MDRSEEQKQLSQDFKETFGSDGGKRVLAKLRSMTICDKTPCVPSKKIDVNRLIYDEAQRAMIVYIDNQIKKDLGKDKRK